jgi:general stress protein 26
MTAGVSGTGPSRTDAHERETAMSHENDDTGRRDGQDRQEKVRDLIRSTRLAMLTSVDPDGRLVSKPMATQDVDFDGEVWFICERDSQKARNIMANPRVNVAYASRDSWVSLSGTAEVVDDRAKLEELWNTFTDAWLEGGPENANNVLIRVTGDSAEYWDTPGGKVTQLANLVKAKATGKRFEADNETVDLRG